MVGFGKGYGLKNGGTGLAASRFISARIKAIAITYNTRCRRDGPRLDIRLRLPLNCPDCRTVRSMPQNAASCRAFLNQQILSISPRMAALLTGPIPGTDIRWLVVPIQGLGATSIMAFSISASCCSKVSMMVRFDWKATSRPLRTGFLSPRGPLCEGREPSVWPTQSTAGKWRL